MEVVVRSLLWCCIFFALVILFFSDRVLCPDLFPSVVMRAESVVGADPLLVMGCSHFFRVHLRGFRLVFFLLSSIFSPERIPILQAYVVSPSHLPLWYRGRCQGLMHSMGFMSLVSKFESQDSDFFRLGFGVFWTLSFS
jgi:hypothetical protein